MDVATTTTAASFPESAVAALSAIDLAETENVTYNTGSVHAENVSSVHSAADDVVYNGTKVAEDVLAGVTNDSAVLASDPMGHDHTVTSVAEVANGTIVAHDHSGNGTEATQTNATTTTITETATDAVDVHLKNVTSPETVLTVANETGTTVDREGSY